MQQPFVLQFGYCLSKLCYNDVIKVQVGLVECSAGNGNRDSYTFRRTFQFAKIQRAVGYFCVFGFDGCFHTCQCRPHRFTLYVGLHFHTQTVQYQCGFEGFQNILVKNRDGVGYICCVNRCADCTQVNCGALTGCYGFCYVFSKYGTNVNGCRFCFFNSHFVCLKSVYVHTNFRIEVVECGLFFCRQASFFGFCQINHGAHFALQFSNLVKSFFFFHVKI